MVNFPDYHQQADKRLLITCQKITMAGLTKAGHNNMLKSINTALGNVLLVSAFKRQKGVLIAQPFSIAPSVLAHLLATWYSQGRSDDIP